MKTHFFSVLRRILIPAFVFIALSTQASAQNISMKFKGTVKEAIEYLQKQYNYSVTIKTTGVDLNKKVNIKVDNTDISALLEKIFGGQDVTYSIGGKSIFVENKAESNMDVQSARPKNTFLEINGMVLDQEGNPIPGVVVLEKGTGNAAITDDNGAYAISVPQKAQLTYSSLGYVSRAIAVEKSSTVDVVLEDDPMSLDEIVVIGYGSQKKSDLTGSIVKFDMKKMEDKEAISVADYLRGSVAGLNISRSSSTAGQTSFEIRGQTSLGTSTSPLLVVDGSIFNGELNDINPNDVDNISVMKDASSAAVYGANAANGVIIINTKEGAGEKPRISFDTKTSISKLYRMPEAYDVDGYLALRADALLGEGLTNLTMPEYYTNPYNLHNVSLDTWMAYSAAGKNADPTEIWLNRLSLKPNEKMNYYNYKSIDWMDEVFRTGIVKDYNTSVSGKSKNLKYYWSIGYLDNQGVVVGDNYKNVRSRINITNDITNFLQVGIRASFTNQNDDGYHADWSKAYSASPLGDMYQEGGEHYSWLPNSDVMSKNPLAQTEFDLTKRTLSLTGNFFAKLTLPFGFTFESSYNNHWKFYESNLFKPSFTQDGSDDKGIAERSHTKQYDWSIENTLHWNKAFGNHRFDLTLLQSSAKWQSWYVYTKATGFKTSELLSWHALDLAETFAANSTDQQDTKASYMARLNYSLLDRYLFTFTFRRDGYSAFGQQNPWADFPAAAFAWKVSEEDFMKSAMNISNLKLRISYGKNGNSNIGRYTALAGMGNDYYLSADKQNAVTLYPTSMGNSQLQWEETLTSNIGIDLGLFQNRLNFTLEGYLMETTNMLMDRTLPTLIGYNKVKSNLGQVNNKGLELTINSLNINNKDFRWNTDFIFSMNRNEIVHLYGDMIDVLDDDGNVIGQRENDDVTSGWYIGHAIDEIYGYKIIGIWQTEEMAEAMALGKLPGDYKTYIGEGHTSYSKADYCWQGFTKPRYRMSMNNKIVLWNNLTFSFMLRSELGHKKANNELNIGSYADRISIMKFPYWTSENRSNYWGKLDASRTGDIYRNASFLRVENVSLSYTIPHEITKKACIENARIFANVDNAYCFDGWIYFDVETKNPTPTTFTFGLSVTL